MKKYIIKNCPLYEQYDCFNIGRCKNSNSCNGIHTDFCKDISNCLLKQIVESCKNVNCDVLITTRINNKTRKNRCGAMNDMPLCCEVIAKKEILNLLEIEEI